MSGIKKDCYWYQTRNGIIPNCRALYTLQCKNCGKCSFYETEGAIRRRMARQNALGWFDHSGVL